MRRTLGLELTCACGRPSGNRKQCSRCAVRASRGTAFAAGSCCAACGLSDVRVLCWLRLVGERVPACGNCAALAGRRSLTLDELRVEVRGAAWSLTA